MFIRQAEDSPCIRQCMLDESSNCTGCWRSLEEIKLWSTSTPEWRREANSQRSQQIELWVPKRWQIHAADELVKQIEHMGIIYFAHAPIAVNWHLLLQQNRSAAQLMIAKGWVTAL